MRFSTLHKTGRAPHIRALGLSLFLTLLGMLLLTGAASAATCNDYWNGLGGDHDWATAANWSAGVPQASTNACIDNTYVSGSYTVDIDTYNPALVANSITVGGSAGNLITLAILGTGGGVDVGNTLTLSNQSAGGGVLSTGAITLGSLSAGQPGAIVVTTGTLVNDGTITAEPVTSQAAIDNDAFDTINGSFDNVGTLTDDWNFSSLLGNSSSSGTINIGSNDRFDLTATADSEGFTQSGGTINNQGSFQQDDGTFVGSAGTNTGNPLVLTSDNAGITVDPSGTGTDLLHIMTGGASLGSNIGSGYTVWASGEPGYSHGNLTTTSGSLINYGTLELGSTDGTHGTLTVPSGSFTNDGTLTFTNTENGADGLAGALMNAGTVSIPSGSSVGGTGAVTNSGVFSMAAGTTFGGTSFTQSASGTLDLAIGGGGTPSVPEIELTGAADLGGKASIDTGGGTAKGTFPIITYASHSGQLATSFTGENYSATYAPTALSLTGPAAAAAVGVNPSAKGLKGAGGEFKLTLSCAKGKSCRRYTVTGTVTEQLKKGKVTAISARAGQRKTKKVATTRVVTVASASGSVSAGKSKALTIKLNSAGLTLLKRFGKLRVKVTISAGGKTASSAVVTVTKAKA
jgi:hypothetical protein